jgi:putative transposase
VAVTQAYRFALDPRPDQVEAFLSHCGGRRFAFNHMLALVKADLSQRDAERSYGLAETDLTMVPDWSAYGLRKLWNRRKAAAAPWWRENSKEAYASGCADLAAALRNWTESRNGRRAGRPVAFPRFKSRRSRLSCGFTTGIIRIEPDRRHVTLPKLGSIRTHESTRKLARHLDRGTGRILSATLSLGRGGRWFVSFTCEIERADKPLKRPAAVVGVDLGIKNLAVLSTGESVPNPRSLEEARQQLRRSSRRLARRRAPDPKAGIPGSGRWERARRDLNRLHAKVANRRADAMHKLTTRLASTFGTIVVEDLHVAGMLKNRRLARHIADASFGEVRRQLAYKTAWRGGNLVVADRWLPSSKTCSGCGVVKAKLRLSERTYRCGHCGLVVDRDFNAARNLANLIAGFDLELPGEEKTARQKPRKTSPAGSGIAAGRPPDREANADTARRRLDFRVL